jgi:CO/xanthine dehydrogenase FAD-binding subunit
MTTLTYARPDDVMTAVALVAGDPEASYLAGGTTHLDLLLKDGIGGSTRLVDISRLPLRGTTVRSGVLQIGALTTMAELADDAVVARELPFVREALLAGASPQLRSMATIGGNLLQRTRCRYFRDPLVAACNKRLPGSGCGAVMGVARMHAVLGASEQCIAAHGSDLCVPLVALDATVRVRGADGERSIPLTELYLLPGDRPDVETVLRHGELITQIDVPLLPDGVRTGYLKVRDRASYEFALVSVAAALRIEDSVIAEARVAVGGVGTVPWRAREAEEVLRGAVAEDHTFDQAARAALHDAFTVPGTQFKVELARRAIVRALRMVAS